MAWTADKPWGMRFSDVLAKFAREVAIPITPKNFLLFMGEPENSSYGRSSDWKEIKEQIRGARIAANTTYAQREYVRTLIANEERAQAGAKANAEMLARYTAEPENDLSRLRGRVAPASTWEDDDDDAPPVDRPKPQLVQLGAPRAYFND